MDRFWVGVGLIAVLGAALTIVNNSSNIYTQDLEVECTAQADTGQRISLEDQTMVFEGGFNAGNQPVSLSKSFRKTGKNLVLRVNSRTVERENYVDTCGKVARYRFERQLDPGLYDVKVYHDSELVSDQKIRII